MLVSSKFKLPLLITISLFAWLMVLTIIAKVTTTTTAALNSPEKVINEIHQLKAEVFMNMVNYSTCTKDGLEQKISNEYGVITISGKANRDVLMTPSAGLDTGCNFVFDFVSKGLAPTWRKGTKIHLHLMSNLNLVKGSRTTLSDSFLPSSVILKSGG